MGVKFEEGESVAQRKKRFEFLRNLKQFQCPENSYIATKYLGTVGSVQADTGVLISYATNMDMLYMPSGTVKDGSGVFVIQFPPPGSSQGEDVPLGYSPTLNKI